eukprot:CAMPEP_0185282680 /NCGR_PEP_ID=MMETSP1359-20130426/67405_1 /TAXON_ID=552665 /ORGANISM="Bigelowiella longifila, Strain CCMP242" /LENGTH=217 /DNA_ID=CAMNT_0027878247 /DNA_START=376 /DNA_END=1029 /DNA_ORIENTATION=+
MFSELRLRANNSSVQGISATGPRALEAAVVTYEQYRGRQRRQWETSSRAPKNGITITDPSVLYPLFDPANRDIKKECEKLFQTTTSPTSSPSPPSSASSPTPRPSSIVGKGRERTVGNETVKIERLQLEECSRLKTMKYENSPLNPNVSYAAHHWVHTWFGSYYGGSQDTDAYDLAREIKARYLSHASETKGLDMYTSNNAVLQELVAKNSRLPGDF